MNSGEIKKSRLGEEVMTDLGYMSSKGQTVSDWNGSPYRWQCWSGGVAGFFLEVAIEGVSMGTVA